MPWGPVIGARNLVVHAYHRIDYGILWNTVDAGMARLAAQLAGDLPPVPPADRDGGYGRRWDRDGRP